MPLKKIMKGMPSDLLAAHGIMYQDWTALTPCQRQCTSRFGITLQQEQEAYMRQHPEVQAVLENYICKMTQAGHRRDLLKYAAEFFTRPLEVIDEEIRKRLNLPPDVPYTEYNKPTFHYTDKNLETDLMKIIDKHYPLDMASLKSNSEESLATQSSSFISIVTSDTTLPTPEPTPIPSPTLSEIMFGVISNTVDKAIYQRVDDEALRYDTIYVELLKAVEEAMEVPVIEIRKDIAEMYELAYHMFEINIKEKERVAAEIAWDKRMRKKLKRSLRRANNFKGYETPPTPKSVLSSHESYKIPPPKPCVCHPQYHYNRYAKDRFGIYLPRNEETLADYNITATPVISSENLVDEEQARAGAEGAADTKSIKSGKFGKDTTSMKSVDVKSTTKSISSRR